jgi:hypothetical protein
MNWRAIGSATSGGLVWASPDSVTRPPACLGGRGDEPLPRRWEPAVSRGKAAPAMIADFEAQCVLGDDRLWRFQSHVLRPIFVGSDVPISLSIDPQHL